MMSFYAELKLNMKRRVTDGFALGYNVIFPIIMILLTGFLCKGLYHGEITSFRYYSVVMIPFCTLMGIVTAAYAGKDDAYAKVAQRVLISPISKEAIVMSKVISCTIVFSGCSALVYSFTFIFCPVPDAVSVTAVLVLLASISFFISGAGTLIGLGMKNFLAIKNVMTIPVCIAAILGGTFFPMGGFQKDIQMLINLSPLTWINRALFLTLYDHNQSLIWKISVILILAGVISTYLATASFQKEEYIHGNIPGYEK